MLENFLLFLVPCSTMASQSSTFSSSFSRLKLISDPVLPLGKRRERKANEEILKDEGNVLQMRDDYAQNWATFLFHFRPLSLSFPRLCLHFHDDRSKQVLGVPCSSNQGWTKGKGPGSVPGSGQRLVWDRPGRGQDQGDQQQATGNGKRTGKCQGRTNGDKKSLPNFDVSCIIDPTLSSSKRSVSDPVPVPNVGTAAGSSPFTSLQTRGERTRTS